MRIPRVTRPLRYTRHTIFKDMARHQENARYTQVNHTDDMIPLNHTNRIYQIQPPTICPRIY